MTTPSARPDAVIRVYTRPVDPDSYPEGLARSVHFSCDPDGSGFQPLNRNYGILFAEGEISAENTIIPMGVARPGILRLKNGKIAIVAERVLEDGSPDESSRGKRLLWETADLIHFEPARWVDAEDPDLRSASETLPLDRSTAGAALRFWSPVVFTGVSLPDPIHIRSEKDLDEIRARLEYSDGSFREKRISWQKDGISFDVPGEYEVRGTVSAESFPFPLARGYGDPVIFPWEGKWYYTSTNDNLNDIGLYVREAETVPGLFAEGVPEHLILPFDPARGLEQTFWAPEFHVIGGELYLLFAVSRHVWGPQCHMMRLKKGGRITDPDSWEDPVRILRRDGSPLAREAITLDMTFLRARSGSYVIWSYREHIGTPLDSGSMLYIAAIDEKEPWRLKSDPVLLTRPLLGWENVSGTINNEGPHAFSRDGKIYVAYSGGSANRYTYALGLLTADTDQDLLSPSSWRKSITPVLTFYSVPGEFGPGHNSFYTNEEGDLMIAYHAEKGLQETLRCDGIRRVHFRADGTPDFQMSPAEDAGPLSFAARVIVAP